MRKDRSFLVGGLISALIVLPAAHFGGFRWLPFVQHLLDSPGAAGMVARIVLWFTVWVALALLARSFRIRSERGVLALAGPAIDGIRSVARVGNLDAYLSTALRRGAGALAEVRERAYAGSRLSSRLRLIQDRLADHNRADRVSFLMAAQSGLESARAESSYGPLRALIWAMPGLGFMGTALEMARAVGGMGASLQSTRDEIGLKAMLAEGVIPHLAGAFDVTLFALGASVVCFLLLALVHHSEEEALLADDELCLRLIAKLADEEPEAPEVQPVPDDVRETLEKLRTGLTVVGAELSKLNGFVERSSAALQAIFNHDPGPAVASRAFTGYSSSTTQGGLT